MGSLLQPKTGRRITLGGRTLIGRSRRCDLKLAHPSISAEHAVIWWDREQWWIRDLGSRNGTTVDGDPIEPAQPVTLSASCELAFGNYPLTWSLESLAPPIPLAMRLDDEVMVTAETDVLALPDDEAPVVVIYGDPQSGWLLEQGEDVRNVADLDVISIAGQPWRLYLPQPVAPTLELQDAPPQLAELSLEFAVSSDEEHVELTAVVGARRIELASRAHHYTLLTLARARLADHELPVAARGWIYQDELMEMLRLDREQLNMTIYRARKQLAAAGFKDARALVERRVDTRQLRLGVAGISIREV